jgi:hypothetical protein
MIKILKYRNGGVFIMKYMDLFENWGLKSINLNLFGIAEMEFNPSPEDLEAAWELYIELVTRIATQPLDDESGVEEAALSSIYSLFEVTRNILKVKGRKCIEFSKIALIMLNRVIRPFTAKWHKLNNDGVFSEKEKCEEFRDELKILQSQLRHIAFLLSRIAQIDKSLGGDAIEKYLKDSSILQYVDEI